MEKASKKQLILVFGIFLLLSLGWFIFSIVRDVKAIQALSWQPVEGTVISGEVAAVSSSKGASKSKPVIRYTYTVDGADYESDRYSSTVARGPAIWAKEIVDGYPAGSDITLYYDPRNPSKSVIDPGLQQDDLWMTFLSLSIFAMLLYVLTRQLKKA